MEPGKGSSLPPPSSPVHPHNQVILATHRTLITTINDSLVPFLREGSESLSILLLPFEWPTALGQDTSLRSADPPSSELMILREEPRCCLRAVRRAKSTFCPEGFQDVAETVATTPWNYQADRLINREAIVCQLIVVRRTE